MEALENHLLPALGELYTDALRPEDLQRFVNDQLRAGYAVATVKGWLRVLKVMMRDRRVFDRDCMDARIAFPEANVGDVEDEESNSLTADELQRFLAAMEEGFPQHYALVATLAFTGLRFSHASALKWEDFDMESNLFRVRRKQVRGTVGPVSRRKRAPRQYPLLPALKRVLQQHRQVMLAEQAPGFDSGWCFPSTSGTLRTPSSLQRAFASCRKAARIDKRFTPHGLRRRFNDLARLAGVDPITTRR